MAVPQITCHVCGRSVAAGAAAVRAYGRVVVAQDVDTPDLRGQAAIFHQDCAPDWGDPDWISRAEGYLEQLSEES